MESLEIKKRHNVLELDRLERTGNIDIGIYLHDSMLEGLITINQNEARELIAWLIEATGEKLIHSKMVQHHIRNDLSYKGLIDYEKGALQVLESYQLGTLQKLQNPANK